MHPSFIFRNIFFKNNLHKRKTYTPITTGAIISVQVIQFALVNEAMPQQMIKGAVQAHDIVD